MLLEGDDFVQYCPEFLKRYLPELLQIVKEFSGAQTIRYDLTEIECFHDFAIACMGGTVDTGHAVRLLSRFLLKQCASTASPIFFTSMNLCR